jgi:hypothetical protein
MISSRVWSCLIFCCGLLLLGAAPVEVQDELDAKEQAKITKYMDLARNGRVAVRPQAAKRLVKMGAPALERVLEACGPKGEELAGLGPYFVEVLADFGDPKLREFLWGSLTDLDFPWRGPAARSLAKQPKNVELPQFLQLLEDRLDQVRLASLDALGPGELQVLGNVELVRASSSSAIEQRLIGLASSDPSDRVRRAAALLLDQDGQHGYLLWLLEDLQRTDTYFRLPLGEQARFAAIRALKKRLGNDFGFKAEDAPSTALNVEAIKALRGALLDRVGGLGLAPTIPAIWKAGPQEPGDVIGLELRSCRVGEFFLRWNRKDLLIVGTGMGQVLKLEPGTVARLEKLVEEQLDTLGTQRYWGEMGCDLEQFRWVDGEGKVRAYLISKGQAKVSDLRPAALDRVARALVGSIPGPADTELAHEIRRALELLGGEF